MKKAAQTLSENGNRYLLSVKNLKKTFCLYLLKDLKVEAVRSISFTLQDGEFGVLSGSSGSGKSTILKCIFRTYLPTSGSIKYRCADYSLVDLAGCCERKVLRIRQREIACVTQFLRCAPRVPAEEVVAYPRMAQGMSREEAIAEARELLDCFAIPEKLWKAYPITFSGGEQQRVNLARAIIQSPRLLLLDEPTASLDGHAVERFLIALENIREKGTTCLGIFHNQDAINSLATQVIDVRSLNGLQLEEAKFTPFRKVS